MTTQMIETVNNRIKEMITTPMVQKRMMQFKTKEQAQDWLTNMAIATLLK